MLISFIVLNTAVSGGEGEDSGKEESRGGGERLRGGRKEEKGRVVRLIPFLP